jgi:BolA protein
MADDRVKMIRQRLTAALAPGRLEIRDDSDRHAGHPGARAGGGHFAVYIVSERFAGKSLLERHRAVYEAMGDAMRSDIHALSIQAVTPEEETKP